MPRINIGKKNIRIIMPIIINMLPGMKWIISDNFVMPSNLETKIHTETNNAIPKATPIGAKMNLKSFLFIIIRYYLKMNDSFQYFLINLLLRHLARPAGLELVTYGSVELLKQSLIMNLI
jgi:hypothetical protein